MIISLFEFIILFTVFTAEFVAIVTVNLFSITLSIKHGSLRTRSMYLVMSLIVADLLVGSLSGSLYQFFFLIFDCLLVKFRYHSVPWEISNLFSILIQVFPFVSLTIIAVISLERFHATFRPFRHRLFKKWVYVIGIFIVWVFPVIFVIAIGWNGF